MPELQFMLFKIFVLLACISFLLKIIPKSSAYFFFYLCADPVTDEPLDVSVTFFDTDQNGSGSQVRMESQNHKPSQLEVTQKHPQVPAPHRTT